MNRFQVRIVFLVIVVVITVILAALFAAIAAYRPESSVRVQPPANSGLTKFETDQLRLSAKYEDGQWRYYGVIEKPTPCHKLSHTLLPAQSDVRLEVKLTAAESGLCATVMQPEEFSGTLSTSSDGNFLLFLNDTEIKQAN